MKAHHMAMATAATLFAGSASANLIISEVVDATLPGGQPKFVEVTNVGASPVDLSSFAIGNFSNGGTTLGGGSTTDLSGILGSGKSYVIAYEFAPTAPDISSFEETYGFLPDQFIGPFFNGDDVLALFDGPATGDGSDANIVDVYGVIGTDGTGEPWEYTDSYAERLPSVSGPSSTFALGEWTIPGPNGLETGDDVTELALILAETSPGSHIPEPASLALAGLGVLTLLSRRR